MDDYVSKPVTPAELEKVLARWVRASRPAPAVAAPAPRAEDALDETIVQSLMSVDDDGTLMDEVVATFVRIAPVRIGALRKAVRAGDPVALERAAHSFYGSCGNLGCRRMADLCARLEILGRSGSTTGSPDVVREIEEAYAAVKPALLALPSRHPRRTGAGRP
jgi:hypothetical protein